MTEWTKELPVTAGGYWFYDALGGVGPEVRTVYNEPHGLVVQCDGFEKDLAAFSAFSGLWHGPLVPPPLPVAP